MDVDEVFRHALKNKIASKSDTGQACPNSSIKVKAHIDANGDIFLDECKIIVTRLVEPDEAKPIVESNIEYEKPRKTTKLLDS